MCDFKNVLEAFETNKAFYEEKVNSGIENYRKGDAKIKVVDKNGKVIPNVKIKFNHKKHEFKFGTNIFNINGFETEEKNELYKKYISELCSILTLPFYWDATEPEEGKTRYDKDSCYIYRRPPIDLCMEFCEQYGIEPREHALAYDQFFPKWLYDASDEKVKAALEKRYAEISERYAHRINTIEVTNEMEHDVGKTGFYDAPEFVEWCFKLAEKYFPNNQLCINEHTILPWGDRGRVTDKYYAYIEANMLKGARIDAIGMQYHLFLKRENLYAGSRMTLDPVQLYRHMDLYARFGKPFHLTEVTVPAYSLEAEDEEMQAEIIEKLLSVWFSYPNVEQVIYWNLVDGYTYQGNPDPEKGKASQGDMTQGDNYYYGGLLRYDMSPKPAYYKIKELLQERWHTEGETVTDNNGCAEFRGFFGEYEMSITVDGNTTEQKFTLSSKANNEYTLVI